MPMLKTVASGSTSVSNVKDYLENGPRQERVRMREEWNLYETGRIQLSDAQAKRLHDQLSGGTRALSVDVSDDLTRRNWARQMDLTRAQYAHDRPPRSGKGRTYYHFILSPSLEDACSLSTLRAFSKEWAERNFRHGTRLHEYAIVPHDDNARGVLHAHIVVNATDKGTGHKLHLSNDEVVALGRSAQVIGERYGLRPIRGSDAYTHVGIRTRQPIYLTREERELLNKGLPSWKWEIRKAVVDFASLSKDFRDFQRKLQGAGYDVQHSKRTDYLIYQHPNGRKVKDSHLGSLFYADSLERWFRRETILSEPVRSSWELAKITKGLVPWKEDIRLAIDAVTPTVMSLPELQQGLERRYGIRLFVDRQGFLYQHPSGFKARDTSLGFRYTPEGLCHNEVLDLALPFPAFDDLVHHTAALTRQFLPRLARQGNPPDPQQAALDIACQDLSSMMVRMGLIRVEDVPRVLSSRRDQLQGERSDLIALRSEVMRWNRLSSLERRQSEEGAAASEPFETLSFDEARERFAYLGLNAQDVPLEKGSQAVRSFLSQVYGKRLSAYQQRASSLSRDEGIYRNFLIGRSVQGVDESPEGNQRVDTQSLLSAAKTLSVNRVRDFFHLGQLLSNGETRLQLVNHKLAKAEANLSKVEAGLSEFDSSADNVSYEPISAPAPSRSAYRAAMEKWEALASEKERAETSLLQLQEAQKVCLAVASAAASESRSDRTVRSPGESGDALPMDSNPSFKMDEKLDSDRSEPSLEAMVEEAKQRRENRLRQAPERSRKPQRIQR